MKTNWEKHRSESVGFEATPWWLSKVTHCKHTCVLPMCVFMNNWWRSNKQPIRGVQNSAMDIMARKKHSRPGEVPMWGILCTFIRWFVIWVFTVYRTAFLLHNPTRWYLQLNLMPNTPLVRACFVIVFCPKQPLQGICLYSCRSTTSNHLTFYLPLACSFLCPTNSGLQCISLLGSWSSSMRTIVVNPIRNTFRRMLVWQWQTFPLSCLFSPIDVRNF
jgi:hypothetical protein